MGSGILEIGTSALNAAQSGILVTGHNIANVNTPGYNRQQTVQTTNIALGGGSGFFGQGVQVSTVQRLYSDFLTTQLNQAQSQSSQLSTYSTMVSQIDSVLGDPNLGLASAVQGFFSATQAVANAPSSVPSRQSMLSASQSLVARFQLLNQQFASARTSVNSQISSSVSLINTYASQIASLNNSIVNATNSTGGQPPNDLMDQRDALISNLSKQIQTTVLKQSDGSYSVFIGTGQGLVVGSQAQTLAAVPSTSDPGKTVVAFSANGNNSILPDSSVVGGALGGLYSFRSQSLDPAQNDLGRIAVSLAQTFNQQQQLGQDLNGKPGVPYFNVPAAVVLSNASNGSGVAANVTLTGSNATSSLQISANLSSGAAAPAASPFDPANPATYNFTHSATIYDSLGQSHNASLYYVKTGTANQWLAYSSVDGNASDSAQTASSISATVTTVATAGGANATQAASIASAAVTAAGAVGATAASVAAAVNTAAGVAGLTAAQASAIASATTDNGVAAIGSPNPSVLVFTGAGALSSATNTAKSVSLSNGASSPLSFNADFSQVTQNAAATALSSVSQNGTETASQLTGNDYLLNYSGGATPSWTLVNTTTNQTVSMTGAGTSSSPFIADGMSIVVNPPATPTQSASFVIKPTVNGAQDFSLNVSSTSQIAAASQVKSQAGAQNNGTGTIGAASATWPLNPSVQHNVTITFNTPATTFNVTDTTSGATLATNVTYTSGSKISYNGWTTSISGTPGSGDTFSVGPNTGGVTDNSNILLLAGLQTQNTMIGNTASYEGAYSQLVSQVGTTANQVQTNSTAQTTLVNQLTQSQQSVSGVNLDEEAANLIRYQQAYQAAGKMIQVVDTLFNTLLQL